MNFIPYFAIFCVFIAAPLIVFGFIYLMRRSKTRLDEMDLKREILELEVRKESLHLETMKEENRKYDRIIEHNIDSSRK